MQRRGLLLCGVGSSAALAVAGVVLLGVIATHGNLNSLAFGGLCALFLLGVALGYATWTLGLMKTARHRHWDWFVVVLLLGMPGALLFVFAGLPEESLGMRRGVELA